MSEAKLFRINVTEGCNFNCAHCCASASKRLLSHTFTEAELLNFVTSAHEAGFTSVDFMGGEPTLFMPRLVNAIKLASSYGMVTGLTSNAWWARTEVTLHSYISALTEAGLTYLAVSYDKYHAKHIELNVIKRAVYVARQSGLNVCIMWVDTTSNTLRKRLLGAYYNCLSPNSYTGGVARVGRARSLPLKDTGAPYKGSEWLRSPYSYYCLGFSYAVFYGGHAQRACCERHTALLRKVNFSNKRWLPEFMASEATNEGLTFLKRTGVTGLLVRSLQNYPDRMDKLYSSSCEICLDLFPLLFPNGAKEVKRE